MLSTPRRLLRTRYNEEPWDRRSRPCSHAPPPRCLSHTSLLSRGLCLPLLWCLSPASVLSPSGPAPASSRPAPFPSFVPDGGLSGFGVLSLHGSVPGSCLPQLCVHTALPSCLSLVSTSLCSPSHLSCLCLCLCLHGSVCLRVSVSVPVSISWGPFDLALPLAPSWPH